MVKKVEGSTGFACLHLVASEQNGLPVAHEATLPSGSSIIPRESIKHLQNPRSRRADPKDNTYNPGEYLRRIHSYTQTECNDQSMRESLCASEKYKRVVESKKSSIHSVDCTWSRPRHRPLAFRSCYVSLITTIPLFLYHTSYAPMRRRRIDHSR